MASGSNARRHKPTSYGRKARGLHPPVILLPFDALGYRLASRDAKECVFPSRRYKQGDVGPDRVAVMHAGPVALDAGLRSAWAAARREPDDFLVQSPSWKPGAVSIAILRKQFGKTHVTVTFDNAGRAATLNFIVVNGPEGWV